MFVNSYHHLTNCMKAVHPRRISDGYAVVSSESYCGALRKRAEKQQTGKPPSASKKAKQRKFHTVEPYYPTLKLYRFFAHLSRSFPSICTKHRHQHDVSVFVPSAGRFQFFNLADPAVMTGHILCQRVDVDRVRPPDYRLIPIIQRQLHRLCLNNFRARGV